MQIKLPAKFNSFNQKELQSKVAMFFLVAVIPVHLILLVFHTQQHHLAEHRAKRDDMMQQVMNVIHMVQATPWPQLNKAIAALDQSKMKVSIDDEPHSKLRTYNLAFWIINRLVPKKARAINLSLHLHNGKWLNVKTSVLSDSFFPQIFLFIMETVLATIILLYVWSLNRFIKPLQEFQRAAEKLGVDVHSAPFKEYQAGPAVVRETAHAMNKMQKRIQDLLDNRNTILAAISHDLRTPITRLKLRLNKSKDPDLIETTSKDLDEMDQMISEILAFARNDHSEEKKSWIDLSAFIKTICDELIDMEWPITFSDWNQRIPIHARKIALKRAIINIINNAIKYGENATVILTCTNDQPTLIINDDGPGIPENELDAVLKPFYRCDRSRSRKVAGTGLGLAVACDAIRANRGKMILHNRTSGGLSVKILF